MVDDTPELSPGCAGILLAGGTGTRMGAGMPKALMPLAGRPMLSWSLDALLGAGVGTIVLVAPPGDEHPTEMALGEAIRSCAVVGGGENRGRSLAAGLRAVPSDADVILVHDAARPLLSADLVRRAIDGLAGVDGAVVAAPATDTLKVVDDALEIIGTADRSRHWRAQTPQVFRGAVLRDAVRAADEDGFLDEATDCSSLVERAGGRVRIVANWDPNPKMTTPVDLDLAEGLLGG